jgi:hypothetical protein
MPVDTGSSFRSTSRGKPTLSEMIFIGRLCRKTHKSSLVRFVHFVPFCGYSFFD